jgi:hypothetical protein
VELILIRLSHNVRQRPRENSACTLSSTDFRGSAVATYLIVQQIRVVVPCRYALR